MKNSNYVKDEEKFKIKKWDILLLVALVLTPINSLRTWKIGPAEILCLLWGIPYIINIQKLQWDNIILKFWLLFLPILGIGTVYGSSFYPEECNEIGLLTYVYFFYISLVIQIKAKFVTSAYIYGFIQRLVILTPIIYMILLLYSVLVSSSLFGMPLWYHNTRFSAGANNPHQLACIIGSNIFANYMFIKKGCHKYINVVCIIFCLIIAKLTASSTLYFSIFATVVILSFLSVLSRYKEKRERIYFTVASGLFGLLIFVIFYEQIFLLFMKWLESDENGMGRLYIFQSIVYTLEKNMVFGLGPGIHGYNGAIEYHNTYLEIIAMSGFIGFIIFLWYTFRTFMILKRNIYVMAIVLPLYFYGLGGFAMRRLYYWCMFSLVLGLATNLLEEEKTHCKF